MNARPSPIDLADRGGATVTQARHLGEGAPARCGAQRRAFGARPSQPSNPPTSNLNSPILVLGCADVASAVAHRLFLSGLDVVLADAEAPPHPRRGMAFTDAWFDGTAMLDGVPAQRVSDADDLAGQLAALDAVACTAEDPSALAARLRPGVLVDARLRKHQTPADLRALAACVVGLGPGFVPGLNCHVAVETAWGPALGEVLRDRPASALRGEPHALDGVGRERFVYAPQVGTWHSAAHIGQKVAAGEAIGMLTGPDGTCTVRAPLGGALRGLSRSGVTVRAGQKVLEVDPRRVPDVHGLGVRPAAIARGAALAIGLPAGLQGLLFGFEASYSESLDCMPMSLRRKLDLCGTKLSLAQWRQIPRAVRETLVEADADNPRHLERMAGLLDRMAQRLGWPALPRATESTPDTADAIPLAVVERLRQEGRPVPMPAQWAALQPLQRYALRKLAGRPGTRNWAKALAEFGLDGPSAAG